MQLKLQPFWGVSNLQPRDVCPVRFDGTDYMVYTSCDTVIISRVEHKGDSIELVQIIHPNFKEYKPSNKSNSIAITNQENTSKDINSVELDPKTGKLVFTLGQLIYVYHPVKIEQAKKELKSSEEIGLVVFNDENSSDNLNEYKWDYFCLLQNDTQVTGATWFDNGNLLTSGEDIVIWKSLTNSFSKSSSYKCSSLIYLCVLSPDNQWFATVSKNDRLVKIWSVPSESGKFKAIPFFYLKHPRAVIEIRWKLNSQKYSHDSSIQQLPVVCTWCLDGIFRIWSPINPLQPNSFYLCGNINPNTSITDPSSIPNQPNIEECGSVTKTSCMLASHNDATQASFQSSPFHWVDASVLRALVLHELKLLDIKHQQGIEKSHMDELHHQLLQDLLVRQPDLLFRVQQNGSLTFWRVEELGKFPFQTCKIFMMTRIPNAFSLNLSKGTKGPGWVVDACFDDLSATLSVYVHTVKGEITLFNLKLTDLLFPDQSGGQVTTQHIWSGQHGATKHLRGFHNDYLISVSTSDDIGVFISDPEFEHSKLTKTFAFSIPNLRCFDWLNDQTFLFLDDQFIYLYIFPDKNTYEHLHLNKIGHQTAVSKIHSFECNTDRFDRVIIGIDFSGNLSHFWGYKNQSGTKHCLSYLGSDTISFVSYGCFDWIPSRHSQFSDSLEIDIAVTYDNKDYQCQIWSIHVDKLGEKGAWKSKASLDLASYKLDQVKVKVGYNGEIVIVPKNDPSSPVLTVDSRFASFNIWDVLPLPKSQLQNDQITDIAWGCSPTEDSFIAIGYYNQAVVYCLNNSNFQAQWIPFCEFELPNYVNDPISHLAFNTSGSLVISAGCQMFNFYIRDDSNSVLDKLLNHVPAKPINSPKSLFHLISWGLNTLINVSLRHIHKFITMQYPDINETPLIIPPLQYSSLIDYCDQDESSSKPISHTAEALFSSSTSLWGNDDTSDDPTSALSAQQYSKIIQDFAKYQIEGFTKDSQLDFKRMIENYRNLKSYLTTFDTFGFYFYFVNQLDLMNNKVRANQFAYNGIAWAFVSDTQEQLTSSNLSNLTEDPSWEKFKSLGMYLWVQSDYLLSQEVEKFGRNQFSADREPSRCGLFYLAMKKRRLLLAMWKSSTHHKEQASMVKFLSNDFDEERWKRAALKNAFVLISRQRYWDSVCFFLLGDALKDSVNVCLKYLNDIDLALLVCRLYDGIKSDSCQTILRENILPNAVANGDREKIYICLNWLDDKHLALQSLILPLQELFPDYVSDTNRDTILNSAPIPELYIQIQSNKKSRVVIDIKVEIQGIVKCLHHFINIGIPNLALITLIRWKKLVDGRQNDTSDSTQSNGMSSQSQSAMVDSGQIDFDSWGWGSTPTPVKSQVTTSTLSSINDQQNIVKFGDKSEDPENRMILKDLERIRDFIVNQMEKEYCLFQQHETKLREDVTETAWQEYRDQWDEGIKKLRDYLQDNFVTN